MRFIYTAVFVVSFTFSFLLAQVPNSGFEDWTNGEPNAWTTNNFDTYITTTQSNSSHSGSSALKGEVIAYFPPSAPTWGPSLICDNGDGTGFPIEGRFNSLKGFWKFNKQGEDKVFIEVLVLADTVAIGAGVILLDAAASYTEFGMPINYIDPATPNRCVILISIYNWATQVFPTLGSEMYIDDLQLSMDVVSDIADDFQPSVFQLGQNYPNPFNPSTRIQYQVSSNSQVSLKVYDVLGNEVATLVNEEKPAGSYEVEFKSSVGSLQLASGIYFYKLQAGTFAETKKMILIR